jgi:hypothetical protein
MVTAADSHLLYFIFVRVSRFDRLNFQKYFERFPVSIRIPLEEVIENPSQKQ